MTLPPGPEPGERTAFPPRSRLARGALGLVLVTGTVLLGSTIVRAARAFPDDAVLRLCIDGLVVELWLATLAIALGLLRLRPLRSSLGLGPGRLGARDVAILVGGTLAISHALDGWLKLSGLAEESVLGTLPRTLEGVRGLRLLAALLCIGVAPGIAEELLCRGLVQRAVARSVGPGLGLIASALVFGALHVEPIHASFATLLGLYLAAAAHWSGSTRVPMLCHAVNNVLLVALTSASAAPQPSPTSTAVAAALGVAALVAVGRRARRGPGALSAGPTGSA